MRRAAQTKWGPASLPAPTAPSEGSAKSQNQVPGEPNPEFRLTSSGVAFHRSLPPGEEPDDLYFSAPAEASLLFRAVRPDPKVKADRCSAALLGMILSCVPLCPPRPKSLEAASRIRKIISSGASSRLTPLQLPKEHRHCPPRRSDLWSPAAPSSVSGCLVRPGTAAPITKSPCTSLSSRKSEKCGGKPVDNVDIGNNRRNFYGFTRIALNQG